MYKKLISLLIILILGSIPFQGKGQITKLFSEIDAIEIMAGPSYVNQLGKGTSIKEQEVKIQYSARIGLNYKLGKKVWLKNYYLWIL